MCDRMPVDSTCPCAGIDGAALGREHAIVIGERQSNFKLQSAQRPVWGRLKGGTAMANRVGRAVRDYAPGRLSGAASNGR